MEKFYNINSSIWLYLLIQLVLFNNISRIIMSLNYIQEIQSDRETWKINDYQKSKGQIVSHVSLFLPKLVFSHG